MDSNASVSRRNVRRAVVTRAGSRATADLLAADSNPAAFAAALRGDTRVRVAVDGRTASFSASHVRRAIHLLRLAGYQVEFRSHRTRSRVVCTEPCQGGNPDFDYLCECCCGGSGHGGGVGYLAVDGMLIEETEELTVWLFRPLRTWG